MLLSEIAAYLALQPGLGAVGAYIRVGFMPDTPNSLLTVYEYGGAPPEGGLGVTGIQYEWPGVQIVCRGEPNDYAGPRAKIEIGRASCRERVCSTV